MSRDHADQLAALKAQLQRARQEAARREAERRERAARAERERSLFARSVGEVTPLRDRGHATVAQPRPAPEPRQRQLDEQAVVQESISDDFDAESLLDTDDTLSFRRRGIGPEVVRKLRRGVWTIQAQTDLHGLRTDEAREQLGRFMRDAAQRGLRCVRVVHGKGLGSPGGEPVLKGKVRNWLVQRGQVLAFTHARPCDGGHGALIVLLDRRRGPRQPGR